MSLHLTLSKLPRRGFTPSPSRCTLRDSKTRRCDGGCSRCTTASARRCRSASTPSLERARALGLHGDAPRIGDVERVLAKRGATRVIGCDEAGRGPLAGPVTVAAVLLDPSEISWCEGLTTQQLSAEQRAAWCGSRRTLAWKVLHVPPEVIDEKNILWASLEGMGEAAQALVGAAGQGAEVLVDGNARCPTARRCCCLVKGTRAASRSRRPPCWQGARDAVMRALDEAHPEYGFAQHKGYPTRQHLEALEAHGPAPPTGVRSVRWRPLTPRRPRTRRGSARMVGRRCRRR